MIKFNDILKERSQSVALNGERLDVDYWSKEGKYVGHYDSITDIFLNYVVNEIYNGSSTSYGKMAFISKLLKQVKYSYNDEVIQKTLSRIPQEKFVSLFSNPGNWSNGFKSFSNIFNKLPSSFLVHRLIAANSEDEISKDDLGFHWTIQKNNFGAIETEIPNSYTNVYIVSGDISKKDVDWITSFSEYLNTTYRQSKVWKESEVCIPDTSKVQNMTIKLYSEYNEVRQRVNKFP